MKINFDLTDDNGNDVTLEELKQQLLECPNVDEDGNSRKVLATTTLLNGFLVLQIYVDDPKLKQNFCLY